MSDDNGGLKKEQKMNEINSNEILNVIEARIKELEPRKEEKEVRKVPKRWVKIGPFLQKDEPRNHLEKQGLDRFL